MYYIVCVIILWLFFFFKQKTAYEMRISDWSSDVCSSDLTPASTIRKTVMTWPQRILVADMEGSFRVTGRGRACGPARGRARRRRGRRPPPDGRAAVRGRWPRAREIGRASCRDRVCEYV